MALMEDMSIRTHRLSCSYGDFYAVRELDLAVPQGAFFGFLGPNGAGKSTTIKMLTGLLRPTAGRIEILGQDLWREAVAVKRQIGVVPEKLSLFERLTAPEYLDFVGHMYGLPQPLIAQRREELLEVMGLIEQRDTLMADYSHGMKKKIALAAALLHNPRMLFLDEPFEGVDAVSARALRDLLQSLVAGGVTIFLTTHILEIVEKLCTHLAIIQKGQLVATGPIQEILTQINGQAPSGTGALEEAFIRMLGSDASSPGLSWIR